MSWNPAEPPIRACVFDAYGTLFDVHSAVDRHRERIGSSAQAMSALWRQKQLEYTWLRSLMGRYVDFDRLTADALAYAMETHAIDDQALTRDLLEAYRELSCYPEVPALLRRLRQAGLPTAILSNGTEATLHHASRSAGLDDGLDRILSVDTLGIYKPDPRVYQLAVDALEVPADQILFHSSNAWDVAGAASFGMRVAWINRSGACAERLPDGPDLELANLEPIADLLRLP
ncbi:haloacid dehalogenase type II [Methylonatrum kenyense]|uniref:haloacid dehalogenase type II n=1 Tax=Methylonatrum kenyense TaxID=455253 RepID=UPI0020BF326E|nr:haloacid dehalogenase type II [Methylonatrum kenyense]MCK8515930.1 haloacid dehalogenase type II [Methylonatrum kenyense]